VQYLTRVCIVYTNDKVIRNQRLDKYVFILSVDKRVRFRPDFRPARITKINTFDRYRFVILRVSYWVYLQFDVYTYVLESGGGEDRHHGVHRGDATENQWRGVIKNLFWNKSLNYQLTSWFSPIHVSVLRVRGRFCIRRAGFVVGIFCRSHEMKNVSVYYFIVRDRMPAGCISSVFTSWGGGGVGRLVWTLELHFLFFFCICYNKSI